MQRDAYSVRYVNPKYEPDSGGAQVTSRGQSHLAHLAHDGGVKKLTVLENQLRPSFAS